jgi:acyl-coenzyme A thioesterase PaaI-like protein
MSTTASPAARRSAEEQAQLDAALADLFERRITFNQLLGLVVESARAPTPRIRFAMRPDLVGSAMHGRLHGGVISSVLDAMGGFALMVAIGERHADENTLQVMHRFTRMGTIDLRVDYLRQGVGTHFVASDADAAGQRPGQLDRHRCGGLRDQLRGQAQCVAAAVNWPRK